MVRDDRVDELISFTEEIGARSPGWYRATCEVYTQDGGVCWTTTGAESAVEDAVYEHVEEMHRLYEGKHRAAN